MSIFQKRHYEKIATVLAELPKGPAPSETVRLFVSMLKSDNSSFKPQRFRDACYHDEKESQL